MNGLEQVLNNLLNNLLNLQFGHIETLNQIILRNQDRTQPLLRESFLSDTLDRETKRALLYGLVYI